MGHREKCLVRTPWADRSSTSAALCCCHCYSKSLCLDHCGQRERQVRATQLWTALAPTNQSHPAFGDDATAWFEEERSVLTAASNKTGPDYCLFFHLKFTIVVRFKNKKRGQPEGGRRHSQKLFIKQCAAAKTQRDRGDMQQEERKS